MDCSDKTRRGMSEALRTAKLHDEALAFVTGSPPGQRSAPPGGNVAVTTHSAFMPAPTAEIPPQPTSFSITFRLPSDLPSALLLAAAERKSRRQTPFTQQGIVAEAIRNWLHQRGYLG